MTIDWRKAMEAQVDTAEWWTTTAGQKYGQGFLEAFNKTDYPQNPITGDLARHEYLQLRGADTYTVTEEMMDVVEAASTDMPSQPLRPEDLPSTFGFLYLPRSYYIIDIRGNRCNVRAIRWGPLEPTYGRGVMISFYSDISDPSDYDTRHLHRIRQAGLILLHPQPWSYGRGVDDFSNAVTRPHRTKVSEKAVPSEIWSLRFVAAFWNLCRGWADIEVQYPTERHLRKRLVRSGLWGDTPTVRVVTLRKPRQKIGDDEGREVAWSHRWIVNVRWRQQHYPSLGPAWIDGKWNPDSHRLVYVMPFVKGPADKPLVVKKNVYRLAR